MRVLAIILGVILILPGLCFIGFGFLFASSHSSWQIGLGELVMGGLITWAAIALIVNGLK